MSLIQTIKTDQLAARKARDSIKSTLLTTLIGEADTVGKNKGNRSPTDDEVVALITKFVKNAKETISALASSVDNSLWVSEITILESYLPTKMSGAELNIAIAQSMMDVGPNKGQIMAWFKKNRAGLYDGAELAKLVDAAINA